MVYLLTIYFIIFTLIAWKNLSLSLAIIIALLPTYLIRFHIFFLPTTMLEIMIIISSIIWFYKIGLNQIKQKINKKIKHKPFPFQTQIILIIIASSVSVIISSETWQALGLWRAYFLEPIIFFLIFRF